MITEDMVKILNVEKEMLMMKYTDPLEREFIEVAARILERSAEKDFSALNTDFVMAARTGFGMVSVAIDLLNEIRSVKDYTEKYMKSLKENS